MINKKNIKCLIPNTHRRLNEAHMLWHQAQENYHDAESFRTYLNATIQALRNITFVLQAEKIVIKDFDKWYHPWQERMRGDKVLSWLHDARTTVVHKKDLDTLSTATVTTSSYVDLKSVRLSVPPACTTEEIILFLYSKGFFLTPYDIGKLILTVERRWVATDLPEWELLDVLAYCYHNMSLIVSEAHAITGMEYKDCELMDTLHPEKIINQIKNDSIPLCMETSGSFRKHKISLEDFSHLTVKTSELKLDHATISKARKRFRGIKTRELSADAPLEELAEFLIDNAKVVLAKDKMHYPMIFLREPKGWTIRSFVPEDLTDKIMFMKKVAEDIKRLGADAYIDIFESWITNDPDVLSGKIRPSESKKREERIQVSVASKEGLHCTYINPFKRTFWGKIIFQETIRDEKSSEEHVYYLQPVIKALKASRNNAK